MTQIKVVTIFSILLTLLIQPTTNELISNDNSINKEKTMDQILKLYKSSIEQGKKTSDVKTISSRAKVSGYGFTGETISHFEYPDKFYIEINLGPISKKEIFDGEKYYSVDRNGSSTEKSTQRDLDKALLQAYLATFAFLDNPEKLGITIINKGLVRDEKDNSKFYKVLEYSYKTAEPTNYFFDNETGRLVKTTTKEMGLLITDNRYNEQNYDGIIFSDSTVATLNMPGMDMVVVTTQLQLNMKLPKNIFRIDNDEVTKDFNFRTKSQRTKFKFELFNNHIYVKARINNSKRKYDLIFDTGAMATVLDKSLAIKLGLKLEGQLPGVGAAGNEATTLSEVKTFSISKVDFINQSVAVMDFSGMKAMINHKFDGLVGYDAISRIATVIDYKNEKMELIDYDIFKPDSKEFRDYKVIDINLYSKIFMIKLKIAGVIGNFLIDTGSNSYFDLSSNFVDKTNILTENKNKLKTTNLAGLGGVMKSRILENYEIDFFGNKLSTNIGIHQNDKGVFADKSIDGIIGSGFLKNFKIILDYKNNKFYYIKNR